MSELGWIARKRFTLALERREPMVECNRCLNEAVRWYEAALAQTPASQHASRFVKHQALGTLYGYSQSSELGLKHSWEAIAYADKLGDPVRSGVARHQWPRPCTGRTVFETLSTTRGRP